MPLVQDDGEADSASDEGRGLFFPMQKKIFIDFKEKIMFLTDFLAIRWRNDWVST
jgi:hypothetical protein